MKVTLDAHPAALLFPLMADGELSELAEDIRAHGLLDPIVVFGGLILDGRNRLEACRIAGVEPRFEEWSENGVPPFEFVLAKNLHRRHLTASQRAALAVELLPHLEAEAKERQREHAGSAPGKPKNTCDEITTSVPRARDTAAEIAGVNPAYVSHAKALKREDPEAFQAVRDGEVNLPTAARQIGRTVGHETPVLREGIYFGKGDKWREASEPLTRYMAAWRKRGFEFRHISPREASKRVDLIDRLIADLQDARADIAPRSQKARLTI